MMILKSLSTSDIFPHFRLAPTLSIQSTSSKDSGHHNLNVDTDVPQTTFSSTGVTGATLEMTQPRGQVN